MGGTEMWCVGWGGVGGVCRGAWCFPNCAQQATCHSRRRRRRLLGWLIQFQISKIKQQATAAHATPDVVVGETRGGGAVAVLWQESKTNALPHYAVCCRLSESESQSECHITRISLSMASLVLLLHPEPPPFTTPPKTSCPSSYTTDIRLRRKWRTVCQGALLSAGVDESMLLTRRR